MLFGDVIAIALSIAGFLLSLQGLWLVCRAIWPARVRLTTECCEKALLKCFLAGMGVTIAVVILAIVPGRKLGTGGQVIAFLIVLAYLVYAGIGQSGLVTHIGNRLASPEDNDRPWKATIRGGVALELAFLIPIVGWIGITALSFIIGAGATTLSLFTRRDDQGHWPDSSRNTLERTHRDDYVANAALPSPDARELPQWEPAEGRR